MQCNQFKVNHKQRNLILLLLTKKLTQLNSSDIRKPFSPDDQSYEDYVDEVEHSRSRNRGPENADVNRILSHLGLPQYEYVDADNYDHLLPKHLTYGKEQTVKIHNGKQITCEICCCLNVIIYHRFA
mgnify:CR=1 FL=1